MSEFLSSILLLASAATLAALFVSRRIEQRRWVAGLLAYIWQVPVRFALLALGQAAGGWTLTATGPAIHGVPIEAVLGASLACGLLAFVVAPRWGMGLALVCDVLFAAALFGARVPDNEGRLLLVLVSVIAIVPAHLLARWTERDQRVFWRSALQSAAWALILLWLFPSIVLHAIGDGWQALLDRTLAENALRMLVLLPPTLILTNASYVFARDGGGTAFPYDPPKRLVTSGVYAYVSNPMQIGVCGLLLGWSWMLASWHLAAAAGVALVLFIVFRDVCNGSCRIGRADPEWRCYQSRVRRWLPRLRAEGFGLHRYQRSTGAQEARHALQRLPTVGELP